MSSKKSSCKHKVLKKVKPEHSFVVANGKHIMTLPDLALEMDTMADEIFHHHVSEARNDFANWVRDVIGEIELADRLLGVNTKTDTQLQILKHIINKISR